MCKNFRTYIYNKKISFVTDHKPLVWFKTADCNTRVQKCRFKFSEFDYEVIYKRGRLNANADALSRNPICYVITRNQSKLINNQNKPTNDINNTTNMPNPINNTFISNSINKSSIDELINKDSDNKSENIQESIKPRISKRIHNKPKLNYEEADSLDDEIFGEAMLPPRSEKTIHSSIIDNSFELPVILNDDKLSKNSDSSSSIIESEPSEVEITSTDLNRKCQIIEVKDLIHCRKDNIIYFVDINGKPCDEGALKLVENNKIEPRQILNYLSVNYSKKYNGYYYFSLCILEENKLSISNIKENLINL